MTRSMKKLPALATFALVSACSDAMPPPLADEDAQAPRTEPRAVDACATPAPGCPCADAGAQIGCGLVYRRSGSHVDCSPGFLTCKDDGEWSACIGDAIWDGG